jgi:hypothetical protein
MGQHRRRDAVFVDDSGTRLRATRIALSAVAGLLAAGVLLFTVSVLGGVPMPGLDDPVSLPSGEPAHSPGRALPTPAVPTDGTGPSPAGPGPTGTTPGDSSTTTGSQVAATARPSSPATGSSVVTGSVPAPSRTPGPSAAKSHGAATTPAHRNTNPGRPTKTHGRQ